MFAIVNDAVVYIFGVKMIVKSVDGYEGDNVLVSLVNGMQAIVKRDEIRIG